MAENPIPRLDHSGSVSSLFSNIGQAIAYGGKVPQYVIDGVSEKKFAMSESVLRSDDFNDKRVADVLQELNMDAYNEVEDELGKKKKEFKFGGDENITVAQLRENPQQMDAFFKAIKKNTSAFTGGKILSKQQSIMQRGTDALINEFALKEKNAMIEDLVAIAQNANITTAEIVNKDPSKYSKAAIAAKTTAMMTKLGYPNQRIADIANFGKDAMSGSEYWDTQKEFIQMMVQPMNDVTSDAGKAMVYKSFGVSETDPKESGYIMVQNAMADEEKNRRNIKSEAYRAIVDKMQATGMSAEKVINSSDFGHIFQFEDTRIELKTLESMNDGTHINYQEPEFNIKGLGTTLATNAGLSQVALMQYYHLEKKRMNGVKLGKEQEAERVGYQAAYASDGESLVRYVDQQNEDHGVSPKTTFFSIAKKNRQDTVSLSEESMANVQNSFRNLIGVELFKQISSTKMIKFKDLTNSIRITTQDTPQTIVRKLAQTQFLEYVLSLNAGQISKEDKEKIVLKQGWLQDVGLEKTLREGTPKEKREVSFKIDNMIRNVKDPTLTSLYRKAVMQNYPEANEITIAISNSGDANPSVIAEVNKATPEQLGSLMAKEISGMKGSDVSYTMSLYSFMQNENINMENLIPKNREFLEQYAIHEFLASKEHQNKLGSIFKGLQENKASDMAKNFDTMIESKVVMKEGGLFDNTFSQWANRNNIHEKSILFGAKDISAADLLASGYPVGTLIEQLDNLLIIKPELKDELIKYAKSVGQDVKDK